MSINFKNKRLRLTTGECIGVVPEHADKPEKGGRGWLIHNLCITNDEKRAIICSYDGKFIIPHESYCNEAGFDFCKENRRWSLENTVNLYKCIDGTGQCAPGLEKKWEPRKYGQHSAGSRGFQIDPTSGKMFEINDLVLSRGSYPRWNLGQFEVLNVLPKNHSRVLRVKNWNPNQSRDKPLEFYDVDGDVFIKSTFRPGENTKPRCGFKGELEFLPLTTTNDKNNALKFKYDGKLISTEREGVEMVLELGDSACRHYTQGSPVVCVNNTDDPRNTRLVRASRNFEIYPDGQIGFRQNLALGKLKNGRLGLVDPDSDQVIKFDIDYLLNETFVKIPDSEATVPHFIEIKNRRIQELESRIDEYVQEIELLKEENKRMKDLALQALESQNKKISRENNTLIKKIEDLEEENNGIQDLEIQNMKLVRENDKLKRMIKATEKDWKDLDENEKIEKYSKHNPGRR